MTTKLEILITARDATAQAFDSAKSNVQALGTVALGVAATGIAAIGTAAIGAATAGASAFIGFQNQMNEVFTLLPGISKNAMDEMGAQVLSLSREFGVLPEKVVPALYQALSAGVPQENVFEFLETATKASIGGITDLETAVDGITSVINAYGDGILTAAQASDIMFTAVRLGKTNFEQLSASLYNVIPSAASLGVKFEDVAANLAVLTAQGVPTSVATTQIRSALNEAANSSSRLGEAIAALTGKSFTELIASGMSSSEVFEMLRNSMPEQKFRELFSSVEAMNAVLGLTGPNAETVASALQEMAGATGATDAAFETMSGGIQFTIERMKAFGRTVLIQIGEALAPLLNTLVRLAERAMPYLTAAFDQVKPVIEAVALAIAAFVANLDAGMSPLDAFARAIENLMPRTMFNALIDFRDNILPGLIEKIKAIIEPVMSWIARNIQAKDVLIALGVAITSVIVPALAAILSSILPIIAAGEALVAGVALVRKAWEENWGGIQEKTAAVWGWLSGTLYPWLQEKIPAALQTLATFWQEVLLPAITVVWQWMSTTLVPFLTDVVFPWLREKIPAALQTLATFWKETLLPAITAVWQWMSTVLMPFLTETVFPWIREKLVEALRALATFWQEVLLPAMKNVWTFLTNDMMPIWMALANFFDAAFTLTLTALQGVWQNVLLPAMRDVAEFVENNLGRAFEWLRTNVIAPLSGSFDGLSGVIQRVADWINNLAATLRAIELPAWMTPGSPTPWELGLVGVSNALQSLLRTELPALTVALRAVPEPFGANASGTAPLVATGGTSAGAHQTIINIDARGAGAGVGENIRAIVEEILRAKGREADALVRMMR